MAGEDDDKPRKKVSHEIGQDLSLLSVDELGERIARMEAMRRTLQHLIHGCRGDDRPDCPILDDLAGRSTLPAAAGRPTRRPAPARG